MDELIEQVESIFYEVNRLCDTADLLEQCDRERDEFINQKFSGAFQLFNGSLHRLSKVIDDFHSDLMRFNHGEHS